MRQNLKWTYVKFKFTLKNILLEQKRTRTQTTSSPLVVIQIHF